ncbi:hypothetical protein PIB30_083594, partial [Stylosanthes scabra]|nr:hypothetical protein [Stylosanthes scabra]
MKNNYCNFERKTCLNLILSKSIAIVFRRSASNTWSFLSPNSRSERRRWLTPRYRERQKTTNLRKEELLQHPKHTIGHCKSLLGLKIPSGTSKERRLECGSLNRYHGPEPRFAQWITSMLDIKAASVLKK